MGQRTSPSTLCEDERPGQRAFGFLAAAPLTRVAMQALGRPVRAMGQRPPPSTRCEVERLGQRAFRFLAAAPLMQ
eukprot:7594495-Alexandrium_andersonii.AAC.1